MTYELWDMDTLNRIGAFATDDDAYQVVRDAIATNGLHVAESLSLERDEDSGSTVTIAYGRHLADLALAFGRHGNKVHPPAPSPDEVAGAEDEGGAV